MMEVSSHWWKILVASPPTGLMVEQEFWHGTGARTRFQYLNMPEPLSFINPFFSVVSKFTIALSVTMFPGRNATQ